MGVHLSNHKFRREPFRGLEARQAFWDRRNEVLLVRTIVGFPGTPRFLSIPCSLITYFLKALFPGMRILERVNERCHRSGDNRHVAPRRDFFEAKKMGHFFISPAISSYHSESEHFKLSILQEHQGRTKV